MNGGFEWDLMGCPISIIDKIDIFVGYVGNMKMRGFKPLVTNNRDIMRYRWVLNGIHGKTTETASNGGVLSHRSTPEIIEK